MKKDLTVGSPLKLIIYFTIPLLIGNLFQQLYNTADTMIVGRTIGFDALAAVGATGALVFFVIGFAQGLTGGFFNCCMYCKYYFGLFIYSLF